MDRFDVMSHFTRVPIRETICLLSRHFEEHIWKVFCCVLMASYFSFAGQFYKQIDVMAMGSPLSPVIANFFMGDFGKTAPYLAAHKPLC
jgi:hypothetical protein